jgi:CRISPR-associated protein Csb2
MTLVLEIEYLASVSFAAIGPDSDIPEWPPQPDRIFSALVATWAAHGEAGDERAALEWLEKLTPPRVVASDALPRTAPVVFVPPNDPRSDRQKNAKGVLPALRNRQPRRFPAARPHHPIVHLHWDCVQLSDEVFTPLQQLARDTSYIGHSTSLTRCYFRRGSDSVRLEERQSAHPKRRVYPGRLAELCGTFQAGRRPLAGARVVPSRTAETARSNIFSKRWLILEHIGGEMPDIRACAVVAKSVRDAVLSGYRQTGRESEIPEVVSGHAADGTPSRTPHLAIVALPFVGFPYADAHVMGFALVPPQDGAILNDPAFLSALRALALLDEEQGRRVMTIKPRDGTPSAGGFAIALAPTLEPPPGKRSLDPALYTQRARTFATVTPVVLDRHLKEHPAARAEEIRTQIAAACENVGLPRPDEVAADKHSAFEGAPSAYPSAGSPAWMRWRQPPSIASRQLTHAVVRFATPVEGPVILGAGRFLGLGLCRPLDPEGR